MKAIAEYFRDLAADDRYFGAEPPTPDAEMLARIAERETARRVDAHEERGKIVLRAETAQTLMHTAKLETAGTEPTAPVAEPQVAKKATAVPDIESAKAIEPAPEPVAEVTPESVQADEAAEKLMDRADADTADAQVEADTAAAETSTPDVPETLENEPLATQAEAEAEVVVSEPVVDSESIAAKLSRIRSVVAQTEDEAESQDQYTEDEHAQDFLDSVAEDLNAILAEDDRATTEFPEDESDQDAANDFEDTLAALMADAEPAGAKVEPPAPITQETEAQPVAQVIKVNRAEFESAVANGIFEEDEYEEDDLEDAEANLFGEDDTALSPEEEAELQRELAEVEAELALDDAAEPDAEPQAELEDEAEDEVAEAEHAPLTVTPRTEVASDSAEEPGVSRLERAAGSSDLTRIFEKTDTQLDAPDSSQRRNAIQHLRAAVAATRAEHSAGSSLRENVDDTPYRSDLANVVRPRRPQIEAPSERSARPEESRPAPLKLVAEQRIDTPRTTIRPRRISTADFEVDIAVETQNGSFIAFAEEMGATSLPDLLEAAAAYLSDVEGRPQFSRPMLMGKLKEVERDRFSREDGLRSFGQLLRQGKLQKLAGGRFAVTEETEFRASGRRQAG
ncbi:hypothetical protein [Roseovarius sp.]|uniref:hypothetical protein n=1 Tax=Roseovarius sp. TaxID=1486281 RepID=UPI003A968BE6